MKPAEDYLQCRIVPMRLLGPDTTERLLDRIVKVEGIRRILLNGQNIPLVVPYGPARGKKNTTNIRRTLAVAGNSVELRLQVGTITLEVEDEGVIGTVRSVCNEFFVDFPCQVQVGRFMKTRPSLVDYAKYGPSADREVIGLVDPKRKEAPSYIDPAGSIVCGGCEL